MALDIITESPGGGIWANKMDVHDLAAMSGHIGELAAFWGAALCGITATEADAIEAEHPSQVRADEAEAGALDAQALAQAYPYTIVCALKRDYGETAQGMGGRFGEQKLAVVNFNLRSYIREVGYGAVFAHPVAANRLAVAAGLGSVDRKGHFSARSLGAKVILADVVLTNLPLKPYA